MQAEDWEWAKALIQCQIDDKRPGVQHLTNRPVINIKQMLQSSAELYGDGIAFYTKFEKGPYKTITHREVFDDVNAMGTALIANGMKDRRIAVIGETTYMWGIGYLGTVCGTGIVVPLDKELPYDELRNLIIEAECSAVIFDEKREDTFVRMMQEGGTGLELLISQDRREGAEGILSQWELIAEGKKLIADGDRSFLDAQIDSREMSIIIFTSGTTGMAKGIMLSHRNIVADLMVSPTLVDFLPSDIFFSVLPIHHTFECTCNFIMPLYKGGAIAHCEGLKYIVKNIQEVHPTFLLAVPAIFEALHKAIWKGIRAKGKEKTVRKAMKPTAHFITSSTFLPSIADTPMISSKIPSLSYSSYTSLKKSGSILSILFITSILGVVTLSSRSTMYLSPGPADSLSSTMNIIASTSLKVPVAVSVMYSPSFVLGRCMPGVSMNTICVSSFISSSA